MRENGRRIEKAPRLPDRPVDLDQPPLITYIPKELVMPYFVGAWGTAE
jgi:hypothetical protein